MDIDETDYMDDFKADWRSDVQAAKEAFLRAKEKVNSCAFQKILSWGRISEIEVILTSGKIVLEDPTIAQNNGKMYFAWDKNHFITFSSGSLEEVWKSKNGHGVKVTSISVRKFVNP